MIYLLPFIAAFIGWITNWIAIKMLFHPKLPINILGITIQGIFPKRQMQFAQKLGHIVSKELISFDEIEKKIHSPETLTKVMPLIDQKVSHFIDHKLSEELPLLSMFINGKTMDNIKAGISHEMEKMFPDLISMLTSQLKNDFDVEKIVTEKVSNFSSDKLEEVLFSIMKKEFTFIEIVGAFLGFIIGWIQILLTTLS